MQEIKVRITNVKENRCKVKPKKPATARKLKDYQKPKLRAFIFDTVFFFFLFGLIKVLPFFQL